MNETQRLAIEIANKAVRIAELETQVEQLTSKLKESENENKKK